MCRIQLKQIVLSPVFIINSLLLYLVMMVDVYQLLKSVPGVLWSFEYSMCFASAGIVLPIPAVLPVVWCISENLDGVSRFVLLRSGKKDYYLGKIGATMLSGMAVVVAASLLFCATILLMGGSIGKSMFLDNKAFLLRFLEKREWWGLLLVCHVFAWTVYASICCMLSLCLSAFTTNRYVLAGVPVVACLGISYFSQATGTQAWLDPFFVTLEYRPEGNGLLHTFAYQFEACTVLGLIYWRKLEGRLRNG